MRSWNIDEFNHMQDRAWELEATADEQDRTARRDQQPSAGSENRQAARALRNRAAVMLAQYWTLS